MNTTPSGRQQAPAQLNVPQVTSTHYMKTGLTNLGLLTLHQRQLRGDLI